MKRSKMIIILLIVFTCILGNNSILFATPKESVSSVINDTAEYLLRTVTNPQVGSIGGEWSVIGLGRSNYNVPQSYYDKYYQTVEKYVSELKGNLHDKKYTEYSRLILALTAIGKDPSNVGGYNLIEPLGDFDKTIWQGINGPIFALIALDSGNYTIPICSTAKTQATREMYIDEILSHQLPDGGFALSGNQADADITGMALQALAKYQDRRSVKTAIDKALLILSNKQDATGGYGSMGVSNVESTVQVLMALCELGVDVNDSRFVKNGYTLTDNIFKYYKKGNGFTHLVDGSSGVNLMSTEQAFYGLVNLERVTTGKSSLYRMKAKDEKLDGTEKEKNELAKKSNTLGLLGKHKDIKVMPIISTERTFKDIVGHTSQKAIEALAVRGIVDGISTNSYAPDILMTRAQFATSVVRVLGLTPQASSRFSDVPASSPYKSYIDTAYSYGIVGGITSNTFAPDKTITRQEAAVMIANAAKLCGMNTSLDPIEMRDMLAQFTDYTKSADWARNGLAFCYKENILSQEDVEIQPLKPVTRGEIAEMLYQLLQVSNLL
ncbi:S-layer homology domain-containing protein [Cellulosilyticum sp. WCF-2]|uniref:S-layer homology domain-containing protein n=1 Tax=Cellulosilyticum sp. WCF-2 TaxID=2497860 RepID=UPI000F8C58C0|nr:S-layer homology domain-containing protein [Cellulosilyticum sp. WCF-2]QEH70025.1 hypothetical protein EKH84_17150 [Cellulosilyticum sp. WCF-2]